MPPLRIDPSSVDGTRVDRVSYYAGQGQHVTNAALDVVVIFIVEAKHAQRLPAALVFSDRTLFPVHLDEPDVSARLVGGGVEHQRQLGAWRLLAELKRHRACRQWKRVVLATPVASRTCEQQVFPGPGEPPVLVKRPVMLDVVETRRDDSLAVAALLALTFGEDALVRAIRGAVALGTWRPGRRYGVQLHLPPLRQARRLGSPIDPDHETDLRGTAW
jgi:hypothetical protein